MLLDQQNNVDDEEDDDDHFVNIVRNTPNDITRPPKAVSPPSPESPEDETIENLRLPAARTPPSVSISTALFLPTPPYVRYHDDGANRYQTVLASSPRNNDTETSSLPTDEQSDSTEQDLEGFAADVERVKSNVRMPRQSSPGLSLASPMNRSPTITTTPLATTALSPTSSTSTRRAVTPTADDNSEDEDVLSNYLRERRRILREARLRSS